MELTHSFTVPATVDRTWETFMDLRLVGGCFPGATVTEVTDDGFSGTVKVKLGPIALTYGGTGSFVERDDGAHRAVLEAKGKDKRGNGTAGATVTIQLTDAGEGTTRAEVRTDLAVTGKPAQFGRGVMQDVSDKLLAQFVACVESTISAPAQTATPAQTPAQAPESTPAQAPAPAPVVELLPEGVVVAGDEQASPAPRHPPHQPSPVPEVSAAGETPSPSREGDTALDLGTAVLPVLLKTYGRRLAAGLLGLAAIVLGTRAVRRR
ncbi:SRPBCC family protein [Pedococcus sp. 5OH_020]|uniref:SRPBCC family protein n=1 Tax=Pedococcus sp. 5OH_020 TaxID=2989814 RepID=UPI0022E9F25B|nr:SRPBCC family protein [Pedococcus sp. 5OH_020]